MIGKLHAVTPSLKKRRDFCLKATFDFDQFLHAFLHSRVVKILCNELDGITVKHDRLIINGTIELVFSHQNGMNRLRKAEIGCGTNIVMGAVFAFWIRALEGMRVDVDGIGKFVLLFQLLNDALKGLFFEVVVVIYAVTLSLLSKRGKVLRTTKGSTLQIGFILDSQSPEECSLFVIIGGGISEMFVIYDVLKIIGMIRRRSALKFMFHIPKGTLFLNRRTTGNHGGSLLIGRKKSRDSHRLPRQDPLGHL